MGRQSSRLYFEGKDHKDIYFQGHYHKAMYIGAQKVWEKLTSSLTWKGYESDGNLGYVRYNGKVFLYIDNYGNLHTSEDAINWTITTSPFPYKYRLNNQHLTSGNGLFLCTKYFYYIHENEIGRQIAYSADGINWEKIDRIWMVYESGQRVEYDVENKEGFVPYFDNIVYANGKYFSYCYGTNGGDCYSTDLITWYKLKIRVADVEFIRIKDVVFNNGYYYFSSSYSVTEHMIVRSADLKNFDVVFDRNRISGISCFLNGIAVLSKIHPRYIYFSNNGTDYTIIAHQTDTDVFDAGNSFMIGFSRTFIYEFWTNGPYQNMYYLKDIIEIEGGDYMVSVVVDDKTAYAFVNLENKVYSLIGKLEG